MIPHINKDYHSVISRFKNVPWVLISSFFSWLIVTVFVAGWNVWNGCRTSNGNKKLCNCMPDCTGLLLFWWVLTERMNIWKESGQAQIPFKSLFTKLDTPMFFFYMVDYLEQNAVQSLSSTNELLLINWFLFWTLTFKKKTTLKLLFFYISLMCVNIVILKMNCKKQKK